MSLKNPKTVRYAAGKLPENAREPFIRAFKACGCMDLYDGNLEEYLSVIAQNMERKNESVRQLKATLKTIEGIAQANKDA